MNIDVDRLREDLIDYFGTAAFGGGFGAALLDVERVRRASDEEVIQIAIDNGFDLSKYSLGRSI